MTSLSSSNVSNQGGRGVSPGYLMLGLCSFLLPALALAAPLGPPVTEPERSAVVFEIDPAANLSLALSGPKAGISPQLTDEQLAGRIRGYISASRATGSPRPLGLAQGLLNQIPKDRWSARLYLLRATVSQRLHQFDAARADLERVLAAEPGNAQGWLTLYSIAMVQGDLKLAAKACAEFGRIQSGLWGASCAYDIASYGAGPQQAFDDLERQMAEARGAGPGALDWALVVLADMAVRLEQPSAGHYLAISLGQDPDDLYRRAAYADWLLGQGELTEVMALTEGYEAVDNLAVLRAIAMTGLEHPERSQLVASLDGRFEEARWRGEFLHQLEFARYLLDVKDEPKAALVMAQANWQKQRAYPDRKLLIRAARAAGDQGILDPEVLDPKTLDQLQADAHPAELSLLHHSAQ